MTIILAKFLKFYPWNPIKNSHFLFFYMIFNVFLIGRVTNFPQGHGSNEGK